MHSIWILNNFYMQKIIIKCSKIGDHFVTHHFDIEKYHIWGVTAFELIVIGTLVFQQLPEFSFFRHGKQLDLKILSQQLKEHFHMCIDYQKKIEIEAELDQIGRLR